MKTVRRLTELTGLVALLMFGAGQSYAAPPWVNQGPPVWCFGLNSLEQCVLFLGTAETCMNVDPCLSGAVDPTGNNLYFCFGMDDVSGQCKLFLGGDCTSLAPCMGGAGQFPRPPRFRAVDGN